MAPLPSRRARAIAVLPGAVLLSALTACGAPSDAPKGDFCATATALNDEDATYQAILDEDWAKLEDTYREQADDLEEVGTPEGIPEVARDGFDVRIDRLRDISADDIEKAVTDGHDVIREGLDDEDTERLDEFDKYVIATCADSGV